MATAKNSTTDPLEETQLALLRAHIYGAQHHATALRDGAYGVELEALDNTIRRLEEICEIVQNIAAQRDLDVLREHAANKGS